MIFAVSTVSAFALAAMAPAQGAAPPPGDTAAPAIAQDAQQAPPALATEPAPTTPADPQAQGDGAAVAIDSSASGDAESTSRQGGTDILSRNTISALLDARLAFANGERSFTRGGFGKTRFGGTANGDYKVYAVPVEADLIWLPRFTNSLSANVSAAWQRGQENKADLIEAFLNYLPEQTGKVSFSARAGLMWPEISLEHSTGGAWSVVNTITPSAINSWVGEEVKVVGGEATIRVSAGQNQFALTGGVFGLNDTSGTLLSFRGWALQDEKATGFGHFPLPPLNNFIRLLQQGETRSTIDLDNRVGFYGRLEWRASFPLTLSAFYYDNRGNPEAFTPEGQWGWRTRFWNFGASADLTERTKLLAQVMSGSTVMGFAENGEAWVHTYYWSGYMLLAHRLTDRLTITGRAEKFQTHEHGSEMSPLNSEDGWALTAAARYSITSNLTFFLEALNVRSTRGTRVDVGLDPFQAQTLFQAALRFRI